jgi:hypothetical protein
MVTGPAGVHETARLYLIRSLAQWQGPAPVEMLVSLDAEGQGGSECQRQACLVAIGLVGSALEEHQMEDATAVNWLQKAGKSGDATLSKAVLQVLGQMKTPAGFRALKAYEADAAVHDAYASALLSVAPALIKTDVAADLKQQLLRLAEGNATVAEAARKLAGSIP